jgi:predicted transcriptional regulator
VSTFQFKAVQLLQLAAADNPTIKIEDGTLTISADRDGDQILITAPVPSTAVLSQKTKAAPAAPVVTKSVRRKPRYWNRNPRFGEDHCRAKLRDQDIREMRALFSDEEYRKGFGSMYALYVDIAKAYNVHYTTVYKIVHGQTWKHVKNA